MSIRYPTALILSTSDAIVSVASSIEHLSLSIPFSYEYSTNSVRIGGIRLRMFNNTKSATKQFSSKLAGACCYTPTNDLISTETVIDKPIGFPEKL